MSTQDAPGSGAEALARLRSVADGVEDRVGSGVVDRDDTGSAGFSLRPGDDRCPLYVMPYGDLIILGVGTGGCRWELSASREDIDFIEAAVESAVAGRVSEVFGPGRSQVTIHLPDGTVERTGQADVPLGCLPWPFWTRRERRRRDYLPY